MKKIKNKRKKVNIHNVTIISVCGIYPREMEIYIHRKIYT